MSNSTISGSFSQSSIRPVAIPDKVINFGAAASQSNNVRNLFKSGPAQIERVVIGTVIGGLNLCWGSDDSPEFEASVREFILESAREEAKDLCHAKLGKITKLTDASTALLGLIIREFAYHTVRNVAHRLIDGVEMQQAGFKNHCKAHYGDVFGTDADGRTVREFAGEVWWRQICERYRVISDDTMDPTARPDDPRSDVFNRWHVLKGTMTRPDMTATREDIKPFDDHLLYMDGGCEITREYQLDYLAYMLQHPDVNIPVAWVFISPEEGTGKSTMILPLKWLFGPDLVEPAGGDAIYGNFHDPFVHKRFVVLDEMPQPTKGGVDGLAFLYRLISEPVTSLKRIYKGASKMRTPHIVITTNRLDAIKIDDKARRFCIALCLDKPKDETYYARLRAWLGEYAPGPGMPKLAGYLMKRDVSKWNPYGRPPRTAARTCIQQASLSIEAEFLQRLVEGEIVPVASGAKNPFNRDLGRVNDVLTFLDNVAPAIKAGTNFTIRSVPKAFQELGYEQINKKARTSSDKAWCWRNFVYWNEQKPRVFNAHIEAGVLPDDYPKIEGQNGE